MWSAKYGFYARQPSEVGCWGDAPDAFFATVEGGARCGTEAWGSSLDAPAVFGLSETMFAACGGDGAYGCAGNDLSCTCMADGKNVLRIGAWTMCENLTWVICAVRGMLAIYGGGQPRADGVGEIILTRAPKNLDVGVFNRGEHFACCGAFAENDVYYVESCVLAMVCANRDELFAAEDGATFRCRFDADGFASLREALTRA